MGTCAYKRGADRIEEMAVEDMRGKVRETKGACPSHLLLQNVMTSVRSDTKSCRRRTSQSTSAPCARGWFQRRWISIIKNTSSNSLDSLSVRFAKSTSDMLDVHSRE